jgi:hypothetical protein
MFARVPYFNGQGKRRLRVVTVPLISALIEPGSRYSIADPRLAPPAPPRRTPKPPPSSSHRVGRPRKVFHVPHPEHDPVRRTATCRRYRRAAQVMRRAIRPIRDAYSMIRSHQGKLGRRPLRCVRGT